MAQEQLGIDVQQHSWDAKEFRLWQSNVADILLVESQTPQLAYSRDLGRYLAGLTQSRRWQEGSHEVLGGTAFFSLEIEPALDQPALQAKWRQLLAEKGYARANDVRFVALPVRDLAVELQIDPAFGSPVRTGEANEQDSRLISISLTPHGAENWARALAGEGIGGKILLSYKFLQLLPDAQARVTLHGARVYDFLSSRLHSTEGRSTGTLGEITVLWGEMVWNGAIEITVSSLAQAVTGSEQQALIQSFAEETRQQLMSVLFERIEAGLDAAGQYQFRWKRRSDAGDLNFSLRAGGWTWLSRTLEVELRHLLAALDESYLTITDLESSDVLTVTGKGDSQVAQVALSLTFSEGHVPETAIFGRDGGTFRYTLVGTNPRNVRIGYTAKILYTEPGWPVMEVHGSITPSDDLLINFDAKNFVRRVSLYLMKRRGSHVETPSEADAEHYILTARAVRHSSDRRKAVSQEISLQLTQASELTLPFDPSDKNARVTLNVFGEIHDRAVSAREFTLGLEDTSVFVIVDPANNLQVVRRSAMLGETDPLAQRLATTGAALQVVRQQSSSSESGEDLYVYLPVPLVPQPTSVSCWVASLTMVISYRDRTSYDPAYVAQAAGMDVHTGYGWNSIRNAVWTWGLVEAGPVSATPETWANMLHNWGPIWIVEVGNPYHAVVVIGIMGDGTPENTWVLVNNPWPPNAGVVEYKVFSDFDYEYGLGAGAMAQLVHG